MKNLYTMAAACCNKPIFFLLLILSVSGKAQESMRANLYVVDASGATLVDGNLTNYNNIYSNDVDINDAWKMSNPGINFGILRAGTTLVVERRSIYNASDTTFFRMWNMPQYHYRIKFILKNLDHPGKYGFVKDNYLNTSTPIELNDTTYFDFTVNANPASASESRFQLIYATVLVGIGVVDVNITGIHANRKNEDILVEWNVVNEESIRSYTVEHSTDGRNFNALKEIAALNTAVAKTYNYKDIKVTDATHFYRIKALSTSGKIQYSTIAKINPISGNTDISVYPNPVVNKNAQLQFSNQPAGKYSMTLLYSNGIQQQLPSIQVNEGQSSHSLNLPQNLVPGIYQLQIIGPDNARSVKSLQVL